MWYVGSSLPNSHLHISLIYSKLVNASSLAESTTATRQGDNIRLLTYISIVGLVTYLLSLANAKPDIPPCDSGDGALRSFLY